LSIDPVDFMQTGDPRYFNRFAYSGNDPVNNIDPDGRIIGKAIKFVRNTIKHKGNPIKGFTETVAGAADDIGTLVDGQLNLDDVAAVVSLVTGLDKKDQAAIASVSKRKKAPNPYGKKGGPEHQKGVSDTIEDVESRGLIAETELKIETPNGEKKSRFVDVAGRNPETGSVDEMHQIGKRTKGGVPIARERRALDDIECATGCRPEFVPYNDPK